ncbi:alpha/beta hydrolase [Noviherbaspirillum agri]
MLTVFIAMASLAVSGAAEAGPLRERLAQARHAAAQADDVGIDGQEESAGDAALAPDLQVVRDVAYGADNEQRFDVYLPRTAQGQNAPLILMVHGGGWHRGDKAMKSVVENKANYWVGKGYIFISTNYRLLPKAAPLEQAEDVARALAVAQRRATSWGGDLSRFILMGHSAGAHLVALLASEPEKAQRLGAQAWLGTVMLDSAALDVVKVMEQPHAKLFDNAFGSDPQYWRRASPFHQLRAGAAPMLMVCSTQRPAACPQADQFAARAATLGIRAHVSRQDLSHREINMLLGEPGRYTAAVDAFIRSILPR